MSAPRGERRAMRRDEDPLDYSLACAMTHHDECEWDCRCWCHDEGGVRPAKREPGPFPPPLDRRVAP